MKATYTTISFYVTILIAGILGCSPKKEDEIHSWTYHLDADPGSRFSKEVAIEADKRKKRIRESFKSLQDHPWAGKYYHGDGTGVNVYLYLAPTEYIFEWYGCLGLYDRNYGMITYTNGRIRLSFAFENKQEGFQGIAPEFIPISWGPRMYLIPEDKIIDFCEAVNMGREPRSGSHSSHFLRDGDEQRAVSGFPRIPDEFSHHLKKKRVEAEITAIGPILREWSYDKFHHQVFSVTLNAGKEDGVRTLMALRLIESDGVYGDISVENVDDQSSEGIMELITVKGKKEKTPQAGWKVSTHLHRSRNPNRD